MNITRAKTQHANLRVLGQIVALDQIYQAKFEHIAGTDNMGTDRLSRCHMQDTIPDSLLQGVYAMNKLDCETNTDFPLDIARIREEQDQDQKLQDLVRRKDKTISLNTLGGTEVYMIKGKVWVPTQLQARIIEWYPSDLCHPGVMCTLNSVSQTFKWKGMHRQVENHIKTCASCQHHKITGKGH